MKVFTVFLLSQLVIIFSGNTNGEKNIAQRILLRQEQHLSVIRNILEGFVESQKTIKPKHVEETDGSKNLPECETPFERVGKKCLYLDLTEPTGWKTARNNCQAAHSDLVVIQDGESFEKILTYVKTKMFTKTLGSVWIGATDVIDEGKWVWVNGDTMKMGSPYWYIGRKNDSQPDNKDGVEHYAELCSSVNFYIDDVHESTKNYGLCERQ